MPAGDPSSAASYFAKTLYFNQPIDNAPLDAKSATIVAAWASRGGWGLGRVQVDFSIDVYYAGSGATRLPYTAADPTMLDGDRPATVPVDPSSVAGFELGSKVCDGSDCHFIVMDPTNHQLIEAFQGGTDGSSFTAGGGVYVWDWTKAYPASLRGDVCTSADASGGMIAPLLFSADEIANGHIDHAIRFIVPNDRIQYREYVRPATHGTGADGWATTNGIPYGARFRLKAIDTSGMTPGAKVVVAAMQKYGIILSDGGRVALTALNDRSSKHKWADELGALDLQAIQVTDLEMVEATYGSDNVSSSMRYDFTSFDCTRNP